MPGAGLILAAILRGRAYAVDVKRFVRAKYPQLSLLQPSKPRERTPVNINSRDEYGYTALYHAAMRSRSSGCCSSRRNFVKMEKLLQYGADIDARCRLHGATPLHYVAASCDAVALAELLIANGADVNALTSAYGETPLHWAVKSASDVHFAMVKALLEAGADPTLQTFRSTAHPRMILPDIKLSAGSTPVHYAVRLRKYGVFAMIVDHIRPSDLDCDPAVRDAKSRAVEELVAIKDSGGQSVSDLRRLRSSAHRIFLPYLHLMFITRLAKTRGHLESTRLLPNTAITCMLPPHLPFGITPLCIPGTTRSPLLLEGLCSTDTRPHDSSCGDLATVCWLKGIRRHPDEARGPVPRPKALVGPYVRSTSEDTGTNRGGEEVPPSSGWRSSILLPRVPGLIGLYRHDRECSTPEAVVGAAFHPRTNKQRLLATPAPVTELTTLTPETSPEPPVAAGPVHESMVETVDDMSPGVDDVGRPPVLRAALWGRPDLLAELLNRGADVAQPSPSGTTAVHVAAITGDTAVIHAIIEHVGPTHEDVEYSVINRKTRDLAALLDLKDRFGRVVSGRGTRAFHRAIWRAREYGQNVWDFVNGDSEAVMKAMLPRSYIERQRMNKQRTSVMVSPDCMQVGDDLCDATFASLAVG
ncbi:Ankyrin Repeat Protein [Perkinsus olseni]|uniref:Ankyrin Repeat Protein n=1 Tax=Perkinsus olseni TaxID=32597 RepID=A0A7J6PZC6_PEROL|nr:Ankyrin Repeat Protein [Perkinsus olseni]